MPYSIGTLKPVCGFFSLWHCLSVPGEVWLVIAIINYSINASINYSINFIQLYGTRVSNRKTAQLRYCGAR